MSRVVLYLLCAALLPWLNQFQDIVVYERGAARYHNGVYMQYPVGCVCLIASLVLLLGIKKAAGREQGRTRRGLPIAYGLFALPALVGFTHGSSYGYGNSVMEITEGIGGPYAWFLFVTAGMTFVCVEGRLRQMRASQPSGGI